MSETYGDHTYTQEDIVFFREFFYLYITRDVESLEIKLIEFARKHNLLLYLDKHKKIAIEQGDKIIPFGKKHDFSLADTNYSILLETEKEVIKDLPHIKSGQVPQYIQDWVRMLNCYACCFFFPRIESTSPEEKAAQLQELKKGLKEADPLFLIDTRTALKLRNGIPFRISLDINPINIQKYFIQIFQNIKKLNREHAKAKFQEVLSEKRTDEFLGMDDECARYALRCMQLFVESFSYQIDMKLREICQDTLTLLNLDIHRAEEPELQQEVKSESFHSLLKDREKSLRQFFGYPSDEDNSRPPGRPKTFNHLAFLKDLIAAAKKIGQSNEEPSKTKIAKELGLQKQKLNARLEEIGLNDQEFFSLVSQATEIKDID